MIRLPASLPLPVLAVAVFASTAPCASGADSATAAHLAPTQASRHVRFLLPHAPEAPAQESTLTALTDEYNRAHPEARVELMRRGENFSSLKELVASFLAGDVPELAAIESSEFPAIEKMKLAQPIPLDPASKPAARHGSPDPTSLPFALTLPVLLADQEMLFRAHTDPDQLPKTWPELLKLVDTLARNTGGDIANGGTLDRYALALPLEGARGLWLFEALTGKPLWKREPGGVRANRDLKPEIEILQKLIDQPTHLAPDETWEKALQAFLDRKAPLLIASLDTLPYIARQAAFRWTAGPVPKISGGSADLEGGSHLVLTRDSPEAVNFVKFLLKPENAARWMVPGGYLPLKPEWLNLPAWKAAEQKVPGYAELARKLRPKAHRTTDPEVVRIHSEWVRALRLIFTDRSQRPSLETTLTQLDSQLAAKSY